MANRDMFTNLLYPAPAVVLATLTASKTDCPVIDRRDYLPGAVVGFLVYLPVVTTADADNYFVFRVFEAAEKTSATALTSGTAVVADDILGLSENGVLLTAANSASFPFLRVNSTTMAGKVYWFQYRGYQNCVQVQPTETGTASIQACVLPVICSGDTVNVKPSVVN